jgi:hypothetical protein
MTRYHVMNDLSQVILIVVISLLFSHVCFPMRPSFAAWVHISCLALGAMCETFAND